MLFNYGFHVFVSNCILAILLAQYAQDVRTAVLEDNLFRKIIILFLSVFVHEVHDC